MTDFFVFVYKTKEICKTCVVTGVWVCDWFMANQMIKFSPLEYEF